jgi:hypothetical protein
MMGSMRGRSVPARLETQKGSRAYSPSLASKLQAVQTSLPCSQKIASLMSKEEVELQTATDRVGRSGPTAGSTLLAPPAYSVGETLIPLADIVKVWLLG